MCYTWSMFDKKIFSFAFNLGKAVRDLVQLPADAADAVDDLLYNFSDKKLDEIYDARKAAAMQNPEYAAIEERRKTGNGTFIMLSNEDGLGMEELDLQCSIFDSASNPPLITPFYRFLHDRPLHSAARTVKYAFQRLTRSWDDTATWSLDDHLCLTLGSQLKHLAETTHGWPQSEKFPEFEDWKKALHENGDLLLEYANKDDVLFAEGNDYTLAQEEEYTKKAKKALRWVAENLNGLWD